MVVSQGLTLTRPEFYESRRIQLTSPLLHIGSAVSQLNPFEYVQTAKKVYLPDREALAKGLQRRGRLNDYIRAIEEREEIADILKQAFGEDWQEATDPQGNPIFPEIFIDAKWTEQKITDLRPMIRNGFGQLYLPGSSIKGAIRTAIAYHLLKHSPEQVSDIERKLRQTIGNLKQKAKFADDKLFMDRLFSDFNLVYQNKLVPGKTSPPNTDFMRAIQITDTEPLFKETFNQRGQTIYRNLPIVAEVIVSSRFPDHKAKYRASIYAEMVRNVRSQFTISLDSEMLSWFHRQDLKIPFQSVEDILRICQEFAQDQWDYEHDYWIGVQDNFNSSSKRLAFSEIRKIYEPEQCPYSLRIGWASGMTGTTINLLLKDDLREEIRDTCGLKAPGFEAPKSRRTVVGVQGEIKYVPGWVKFKAL
jgi:CRISPR-associated protein Csm5